MEKLSQLGLLGAPSSEAFFDPAVPQADTLLLAQDRAADMLTADGPCSRREEGKIISDEGVQYERLHSEGEGRQQVAATGTGSLSRSPSARSLSARGPRRHTRRAHSQMHMIKPQNVAIRLSGMVF